MERTTGERGVRFGPFEVDLKNREVRRQGVRLRLQRQPFAVLEALLEEPGDIVTREALRQRLWPDGTFVEFDKGLNTAVMKLREALGEDPQSLHFIETVAREGYRFVALVETVPPALDSKTSDEPASAHVAIDAESPSAPAAQPAKAPPWSGRPRWAAAGWAASALGGLGMVAIAALVVRPSAAPLSPRPLVFVLREPAGATFSTSGSFMAISPDGRAIAFVASTSDGVDRLWLQPLDSLTAKELEGTEQATHPFWSPDSAAVAFFAEGRLKRIDLAGGPPRTLDAVFPVGFGGTWGGSGAVLYSLARAGTTAEHRGLVLAFAEGGPGSPLPLPTGIHSAAYLSWPRFVPGSRSYVVLAQGGDRERSGIFLASLDGGPAHRLSPAMSSAEPVDGRLLYVDRGVLLAQPFDAVRGRTTGAAVPLADGVPVNPRTGRAAFTVSAAGGGVVAYRQRASSHLEWFDRGGSSLGSFGSPALYHDFSIAPDGQRVAASVVDPLTGTHDIWILGPAGAKTRFTLSLASEVSAQWSEDGSRIAYASDANGRWEVLVKSVKGGEESTLVAESSGIIGPNGWNGPVLRIGRSNPQVEVKLHDVPGIRLVADPAMGIYDSASPDQRWLAYNSDDATSKSRKSLYVGAVAPGRGRWQVAARGGEPRWRADAAEIFYQREDLTLMSIRVDGEAPFAPPQPLFTMPGVKPSGLEGSTYAVTADGQRFLVKVASEPAAIVVIANWTALLDE